MKISLLLPSRNRPEDFERMWTSAVKTATDPKNIEFVVYRDEDDKSQYNYPANSIELIGDRCVLSEMWNRCQQVAEGEIYMHCGDDIIFQTVGWDTLVRNAFESSKDRIIFVHGNDGFFADKFGTHGFIHKNWVDTVGYFVPPYFSSDFNDTWLNDVANMIGRRVYLPFTTEHMHWTFGKHEFDITHQERVARHNADNVEALYTQKIEERKADAEKLKEFISSFK